MTPIFLAVFSKSEMLDPVYLLYLEDIKESSATLLETETESFIRSELCYYFVTLYSLLSFFAKIAYFAFHVLKEYGCFISTYENTWGDFLIE